MGAGSTLQIGPRCTRPVIAPVTPKMLIARWPACATVTSQGPVCRSTVVTACPRESVRSSVDQPFPSTRTWAPSAGTSRGTVHLTTSTVKSKEPASRSHFCKRIVAVNRDSAPLEILHRIELRVRARGHIGQKRFEGGCAAARAERHEQRGNPETVRGPPYNRSRSKSLRLAGQTSGSRRWSRFTCETWPRRVARNAWTSIGVEPAFGNAQGAQGPALVGSRASM